LAADDDYYSEKGCGRPADIVFVLDESGSIWGPHFTKQLEFVQSVVDTFDVRPNKTHIGVLTFGSSVRSIFHLGQLKSEDALSAEIKEIRQMRGETYTHEALERMRTEMFAPEYARTWVPHIGIVITDGESNFPSQTALEAERAHEDRIQIFAVGVGPYVNKDELAAIASGGDFVFEVDNYGVLDELRQLLAWKACQVTTIATTTTTTTTTTPPPPQMIEACTGHKPMDVIFAAPDQASPDENNYVLDLIGEVAGQMKLSPLRVQVGLSPRRCQPGPAIRLMDHDSVEGFTAALARRRYSTDATTHAHIKYIHSQGMSAESGGRADTVKFGVLVVDRAHGENLAKALAEAEKAKEAGISLVVIGVGPGVTESELLSLASSPDNILSVGNYHELSSRKDELITIFCRGIMASPSRQRRIFLQRYLNAFERN
jgi:collagen type VI alpha